jgi:hypothetical protein
MRATGINGTAYPKGGSDVNDGRTHSFGDANYGLGVGIQKRFFSVGVLCHKKIIALLWT